MIAAPSSRIALTIRGARVSYAELHGLVGRAAATLADFGDGGGILEAEPSAAFIADFLACLKRKIPCAILSKTSAEQERRQQTELLEKHRLALDPRTAVILFTSGTGGAPKAVQLSLENIRANTEAVIGTLGFRETRRQLLALPLSYSFGLLGQLLPALAAGVETEFVMNLVELTSKLRESSAPVMISGVPSQYEAFLRIAETLPVFESVAKVVSAGGHLSAGLRQRLKARFAGAVVFDNYGQTEASPRILSLSSRDPRFDGDATGVPVPGIEIRVSGSGELLVKGPQVMLGYLGDAEATERKILNGWLHTGDTAELRADGSVRVTGRKDDLVKISGERVSLVEIESALKTHPALSDAALAAIPDPISGNRLLAFAVARENLAATEIDAKTLIRHLRGLLSEHKIPKEYRFVAELPRNANGKLARARLKALL